VANASFLMLKHFFTLSTNVSNFLLLDICKKKVNMYILTIAKSLWKLCTCCLGFFRSTIHSLFLQIFWLSLFKCSHKIIYNIVWLWISLSWSNYCTSFVKTPFGIHKNNKGCYVTYICFDYFDLKIQCFIS